MLKAENKRLIAVIVRLDGNVDGMRISSIRNRASKSGCDIQILRFNDPLGETILVFEVYNGYATFVQKCRYIFRKVFTAALSYVGFRDILVSVVIEGDPDRFPVYGAFKPSQSLFDKLRFTRQHLRTTFNQVFKQ